MAKIMQTLFLMSTNQFILVKLVEITWTSPTRRRRKAKNKEKVNVLKVSNIIVKKKPENKIKIV